MQFSVKIGQIVCWRPPLGLAHPLWEILDPPLLFALKGGGDTLSEIDTSTLFAVSKLVNFFYTQPWWTPKKSAKGTKGAKAQRCKGHKGCEECKEYEECKGHKRHKGYKHCKGCNSTKGTKGEKDVKGGKVVKGTEGAKVQKV